jgi:hypothetical protein
MITLLRTIVLPFTSVSLEEVSTIFRSSIRVRDLIGPRDGDHSLANCAFIGGEESVVGGYSRGCGEWRIL